MRNLNFLAALLVLCSAIPFATCEIMNARIVDDSRPMILFERFGFADDGHADVSVRHVSWKPSHRHQSSRGFNLSNVGFLLVRDVLFTRIMNESDYSTDDGFCVLSSRFVNVIFRFDKLAADSSFSGSIVVAEPDEYSLVFGNCQPEFKMNMNVHTEMYNVYHDGSKDFLPAGQIPLPGLYFMFFLVYIVFDTTWVGVCVKQRRTVSKIHVIMGALLLFKALKMICASEDKMYIGKTGTPRGWDVAFYVFGFLKGVTLFTVIILIGTGWSFLKPYLQEREKSVLMFVIPLQVLENIASVVIGETGPVKKDYFTWNEMFLLIDVICCCTVLFPITWSIRGIREASKTDGRAAKNLEKLTLFKQFYTVLIAYLYFTRVVVSATAATFSYRFEWISTAAAEGASFIFYLFIFYNFQPIEKNPYLVISDEEEANAGKILEDENSFEL